MDDEWMNGGSKITLEPCQFKCFTPAPTPSTCLSVYLYLLRYNTNKIFTFLQTIDDCIIMEKEDGLELELELELMWKIQLTCCTEKESVALEVNYCNIMLQYLFI